MPFNSHHFIKTFNVRLTGTRALYGFRLKPGHLMEQLQKKTRGRQTTTPIGLELNTIEAALPC
jgi:hypothetical protein